MEHQETAHFAPGQHVDPRAQLHAGVGRFMAGVYLWMAVGVGVTAAIAGAISMDMQLLVTIHGSWFRWVALFAPLAFVWFVGDRIPTMDRAVAFGSFIVYAALVGVMFSYIPFMFDIGTLSSAFITSAAAFGGLAAYGYLTKRDLSPMSQMLFLGVIGVFAGIILSWFIPGLSLFVSVIGVLIFGALTAFYSQQLRQLYLSNGDGGNLTVVGALILYAAFMNMFQFILHLFAGGSRD